MTSSLELLEACDFDRHMATSGFALIPDAFTVDRSSTLLHALSVVAEAERDANVAWFSHGNQRVFNLVAKHPEFLALIDDPTAMECVERTLGRYALLSSLTANITQPNNTPQQLHSDQGHLPEPWHRSEAVNLIWILDDFTEENGATVIVPGSHLIGLGPRAVDVPTVPIVAPRGSLVVLDGRVWHGSGTNKLSKGIRRAIFGYYCRPYLRPQENFARSLDGEMKRTLSRSQRSLLGFDIWNGLGVVNGLPVAWMDGRERIGGTNADGIFSSE